MDSKVSDSYPSLEILVRSFRIEQQVRVWNMKGRCWKISQGRKIPKQQLQNNCYWSCSHHCQVVLQKVNNMWWHFIKSKAPSEADCQVHHGGWIHGGGKDTEL